MRYDERSIAPTSGSSLKEGDSHSTVSDWVKRYGVWLELHPMARASMGAGTSKAALKEIGADGHCRTSEDARNSNVRQRHFSDAASEKTREANSCAVSG